MGNLQRALSGAESNVSELKDLYSTFLEQVSFIIKYNPGISFGVVTLNGTKADALPLSFSVSITEK